MSERLAIKSEDRRFFGVSLSAETADLLTAAARRKGLTTSQLIEKLCVAAIVKDAEVRV